VHSRRIDPIKRSTYPFCQGEHNEVGRSRIPIARTRALNATPNALSLSRIRYFGALFHGNASVIWRSNHSAVGSSYEFGDHDSALRTPRCRVSSNYPNSKLGEFEIVREVHDIQGGNGADASFRFLTINRQNVMSVGTNIEVNIRATYSVLIAREQSSKGMAGPSCYGSSEISF
jgi:hypothetical protein